VADWDLSGLSDQLREFIAAAPQIRAPHIEFLKRAAAELGAGATVLDVGSGEAPYRELFASQNYLTLDWAQTGYEPAVPVDFVAPADAIPLAAASLDGMLCTQVLEHLPEPKQVLDEFARVLKPNGTLWLTVPLTWYMHEIPNDFYRYTPWGLRYVLERSGFVDVEVRPMNDSPGTIAELLRHLRWILGTPSDDGLDDRRDATGDLLARLGEMVESVGYMDRLWLLPLSLSARAVRPTDLPRPSELHSGDHP